MDFPMRFRRKTIKGKEYHYLHLDFRIDKVRSFSVYAGKTKPGGKKLEGLKKKLLDKAISRLIGKVEGEYLSKKQILTCEVYKRRYENKLKKLTKKQIAELQKIEASNFVYTTLATEGVPITRNDVKRAIGISKKRKILRDDISLDISLSMVQGLNSIQNRKNLSLGFVKSLHKNIMRDFIRVKPGKFRTGRARIIRRDTRGGGTVIKFKPTPPEQIPKMMKDFVKWYNEVEDVPPLEKAALTHLKLYIIHPFNDGNKRMSRLLFNKALYEQEFPMLNISKNEEGYFDALIRSAETKKPKYFIDFVYSAFIKKKLVSPKNS